MSEVNLLGGAKTSIFQKCMKLEPIWDNVLRGGLQKIIAKFLEKCSIGGRGGKKTSNFNLGNFETWGGARYFENF